MCAHVPETAGVTALRVLLVADLVARVAELGHLQALTVLVTADESAERMSELESAADALGIHPPAGRARSGNAPALLGGPADVHVVSSGNDKIDDQGGVVTRVGDVHMPHTGARGRGQRIRCSTASTIRSLSGSPCCRSWSTRRPSSPTTC